MISNYFSVDFLTFFLNFSYMFLCENWAISQFELFLCGNWAMVYFLPQPIFSVDFLTFFWILVICFCVKTELLVIWIVFVWKLSYGFEFDKWKLSEVELSTCFLIILTKLVWSTLRLVIHYIVHWIMSFFLFFFLFLYRYGAGF